MFKRFQLRHCVVILICAFMILGCSEPKRALPAPGTIEVVSVERVRAAKTQVESWPLDDSPQPERHNGSTSPKEGTSVGPVSVELIRNGSFEYWNEDGLPFQWSLRSGIIEKTLDAVLGASAARLSNGNGVGDVALRTLLELPENSGGKTLKLTVQAKAPQDSFKVFIGSDELGRLGRLRASTRPDVYTEGVLRVKLPELEESELWLLLSATLDEGESAFVDAVSLVLLPEEE